MKWLKLILNGPKKFDLQFKLLYILYNKQKWILIV
jgi:hypothetical protein